MATAISYFKGYSSNIFSHSHKLKHIIFITFAKCISQRKAKFHSEQIMPTQMSAQTSAEIKKHIRENDRCKWPLYSAHTAVLWTV